MVSEDQRPAALHELDDRIDLGVGHVFPAVQPVDVHFPGLLHELVHGHLGHVVALEVAPLAAEGDLGVGLAVGEPLERIGLEALLRGLLRPEEPRGAAGEDGAALMDKVYRSFLANCEEM